MDYTEVGLFAGAYLLKRYPGLLQERYALTELPESPYDLIEAVGRRRGLLATGGVVDQHKAAEALLRELRAGKIGRISLEEPLAVAAVSV
jgi:ribosome biogenesis GTPase A